MLRGVGIYFLRAGRNVCAFFEKAVLLLLFGAHDGGGGHIPNIN